MSELTMDTLKANEAVIARGQKTFIEVGQALMRIRDGRQYKQAGFDTFEDYCRDKWGLSKPYATRTIEAAKVAEVLVPIGTIPANEGQARELAPLLDQPEKLKAAWQEVKGGGKVTAAKIRTVVKRLKNPEPKQLKREPKSQPPLKGGELKAPNGKCKVDLLMHASGYLADVISNARAHPDLVRASEMRNEVKSRCLELLQIIEDMEGQSK